MKTKLNTFSRKRKRHAGCKDRNCLGCYDIWGRIGCKRAFTVASRKKLEAVSERTQNEILD